MSSNRRDRDRREANEGMAGRACGGVYVGGTETEIERKQRRMNEPQCFLSDWRRRGCEKEKSRGQKQLGQPRSGGGWGI